MTSRAVDHFSKNEAAPNIVDFRDRIVESGNTDIFIY